MGRLEDDWRRDKDFVVRVRRAIKHRTSVCNATIWICRYTLDDRQPSVHHNLLEGDSCFLEVSLARHNDTCSANRLDLESRQRSLLGQVSKPPWSVSHVVSSTLDQTPASWDDQRYFEMSFLMSAITSIHLISRHATACAVNPAQSVTVAGLQFSHPGFATQVAQASGPTVTKTQAEFHDCAYSWKRASYRNPWIADTSKQDVFTRSSDTSWVSSRSPLPEIFWLRQYCHF